MVGKQTPANCITCNRSESFKATQPARFSVFNARLRLGGYIDLTGARADIAMNSSASNLQWDITPKYCDLQPGQFIVTEAAMASIVPQPQVKLLDPNGLRLDSWGAMLKMQAAPEETSKPQQCPHGAFGHLLPGRLRWLPFRAPKKPKLQSPKVNKTTLKLWVYKFGKVSRKFTSMGPHLRTSDLRS